MTDKEKLSLLLELKGYIETPAFQEFIMKPIYGKLDELKPAYDCKTLHELNALKGEAKGLKEIISVLKNVEVELKNTEYALEEDN